jgi:hypothetical protein
MIVFIEKGKEVPCTLVFFLEVGRGGPYLICIKIANCTNEGPKPRVSEKKLQSTRERIYRT